MTPLGLQSVLRGSGAVVRGVLADETVFTAFERNARTLQLGALFIALRGERFDGHDFVTDAAAAGAAAAMVSREWADEHAEPPLPLLIVDSPLEALQRLAAWWRDQ